MECISNSMSLLLYGRDTYSAIIYNYIKNLVKHVFMKAFIPEKYATGKQYTIMTLMHKFTTWGTELEITAFAQLTGFDVFVYTQQRSWARYSHDPVNSEHSDRAFYMTNESGSHFNPIFNIHLFNGTMV